MMAERQEAGALPTTILRELADGRCHTIDALAARLTLDRGQISDGMARLILRGLGERIEAGCYQLTQAGLEANARGDVIKPGPWRADTAKVRKPVRNTFRQRLWTAMRMSGTFTIGELVIAAARDDVNPEDNASRFIRRLKSAGYIAELPSRQKGTRVTSTGFKRYRLLKDTGPQAPQYRPTKDILHDYNTGEDLPCVSHP